MFMFLIGTLAIILLSVDLHRDYKKYKDIHGFSLTTQLEKQALKQRIITGLLSIAVVAVVVAGTIIIENVQ
jgi:hypothetical protein